MQGVSDIMALCGAGTSSLCVNGSVDMTDGLTGLGGSTYINYAPYADAPEEGEFDWGGFARNLVMGFAVGAACIAMSLLLPGIGTIAAGALMGAGIGAVSASVAGAVGDYSSGNVRSTEEVIRDVAVSMVSGALTGAITGGLGAKLTSAFPKAAEAVGKIPLADWAKVGLFNTGDGILGRLVYAVADGNMSVEEKFAYAFSPEHMAMDFLGGAAMYGMSKAVPKIREKLPWNKISNEGGTPTSRPTWRQSELDAATDFPDYDAQKSFINGEEVPYGTKGSVRPDYYKDGFSVDIKNYNVESASGRSNLARNIEKQYYQRIENLPDGTKQSVMIDIRGQNVSDEALGALYDDIMQRTNNGVEILFKMD